MSAQPPDLRNAQSRLLVMVNLKCMHHSLVVMVNLHRSHRCLRQDSTALFHRHRSLPIEWAPLTQEAYQLRHKRALRR